MTTTMTVPKLSVRMDNDRAHFAVARGEGVSDDAWLGLRAELGSEGAAPGREVLVPVEQVLTRLDWLRRFCVGQQVGVEWCPESRRLIQAIQQDRAGLSAALQPALELTAAELKGRLTASRFTAVLEPFQLSDLGRQLALRHGGDFSACGAGKTVKAYAAYELRRLLGQVKRMLVIAPLSAFDAWEGEARSCFNPPPSVGRVGRGPLPAVEVLLVHYQVLPRNQRRLLAWLLAEPTLVVLDEGHRIKRGRRGAWGTAALALGLAAAHRLLLTGTPAPQGLTDLQALFEFLWPTHGASLVPQALVNDPRLEAADQVAERLRPLYVRTGKGQLGLLPPTLEVIREPMAPLQAELYRSLRGRLAGQMLKLGRRDPVRLGECVLHLVQAAVNPALLSETPRPGAAAIYSTTNRVPDLPEELLEAMREYDLRETPWKYRRLALLLEERARQGRKVIVWSNFPDNLERLRALFARYRPAVIHGRVPSARVGGVRQVTREQELARFRNDPACRLLLANPAATGEGVSLHQACHDAIYLDRTFNAVHYLQSVDRIHRLGMAPNQATTVTFLLSAGSLDEHVDRRVREKAERLGRVLEDPEGLGSVVPDEDDRLPGLGYPEAADMAALFEHLRSGE